MRTKQELMNGITKDVLQSKIIANNTLRVEYTDGSKAIRLHNTDVVTTLPNGDIVLNSGGWKTATTKDRINEFGKVRVYQEKSVWYVLGSMFYDGMVIRNGKVLRPKQANLPRLARQKARIAKFVNQLNKDNLPVPESGDCWVCMMFKKTDCLEGHLKENYLHGSLLVNAMRAKGYNDQQIGLHYSMKLADTFKRALRSYLQKNLITNIAVR